MERLADNACRVLQQLKDDKEVFDPTGYWAALVDRPWNSVAAAARHAAIFKRKTPATPARWHSCHQCGTSALPVPALRVCNDFIEKKVADFDEPLHVFVHATEYLPTGGTQQKWFFIEFIAAWCIVPPGMPTEWSQQLKDDV